MFGCFLVCEMKMIAGRKKGFARDTSDIQAGAAQLLVFFNQRGLKSELAGADSGDVATRTGADNNDVKFVHGLPVNPLKKW
jgi:hypothetical protein